MQLRDILTPTTPLGPARHETVMGNLEGHSSNTLICKANVFDDVLEENRPLIVGRRGSGKTALMSAIIARQYDDDYTKAMDTDIINNRNFDLFINSRGQLSGLIDSVGRDARFSLGGDNDWDSLLQETVAQHWKHRIWRVIFEEVHARSFSDRRIKSKLAAVVKYVDGQDILPDHQEITSRLLSKKFAEMCNLIEEYLGENRAQCLIVIDSLEEYPVRAPKFRKVIGGFIRCINDFNENRQSRVRIVLCLPEEVEDVILREIPNHLKDFSDGTVSRLRWRPRDILAVIAERYREFLKIYSPEDDLAFSRRLVRMDFTKGKDLNEFYSSVLPKTITNRLGREEDPLAYIIRHTQLLPREFVMIFNSAIVKSHRTHGSWRYIDSDSIVQAVESMESVLVREIQRPFMAIYGQLLEEAERVIPELSPVCGSSDLDRLNNRFKAAQHETEHPWHALFKIGILGYIEERSKGSGSERYEYGRFHFNSVKPFVIANGKRYCIHPAFSGTWQLKRKTEDLKCVYPADVSSAPWD